MDTNAHNDTNDSDNNEHVQAYENEDTATTDTAAAPKK